jgi:RNA polymerase sigma-70 factor (ECF subfamily)
MKKDTHPIGPLITKAQDGDVDAFRQLYDCLADRLFLYIRSRTPTREDALDILQDTLVDFWKALGSFTYSSDKEAYGFLYTIASRKIAKLYQSAKPTVDIDELRDFLKDPQDALATSEVSHIVGMLDRLGPDEREVIELRYFAGLPFGEIAEALSQTETAVKVRHHRTIQKLKSLLGYV